MSRQRLADCAQGAALLALFATILGLPFVNGIF